MNEKLQYATMLEIPVNTCNVMEKTGKRKKSMKKRIKNAEEVKEQLVNKINSETSALDVENTELQAVLSDEGNPFFDAIKNNSTDDTVDNEVTETVAVRENVKPKRRRFSLVATQLVIIGVLVATIFLTNALYADSGINVFFKSVFGNKQTEVVDARLHSEFTPVLAVGDMSQVTVDGGVMTFCGEGSVYAPCDGTVTMVAKDGNGKYLLEITHSENFKSVITGVDISYAGLDDKVFANIPVGYVNGDGATLCFKGVDDAVIVDYEIIDGSVVWAV